MQMASQTQKFDSPQKKMIPFVSHSNVSVD